MKKHLPSRSRTRRTILLQLALIIGVAISAIALQSYAASVFVQPSSAPPGGNALAPLNVGNNKQTRVGTLTIENGLLLNTAKAPNGLIVANGNVGIGTLHPTTKLDVNGNVKASGEVIGTLGSGYGQFRMVKPGSTYYGSFFRNDGGSTYLLLTNRGNQYGGWNNLRPFAIDDATGNVHIGNDALFVKDSGNVGIGTTNPTTKLDVNGKMSTKEIFFPDLSGNGLQHQSIYNWKGAFIVADVSPSGTYQSTNLSIDKSANMTVPGSISTPRLCLNGVCKSSWSGSVGPKLVTFANFISTYGGHTASDPRTRNLMYYIDMSGNLWTGPKDLGGGKMEWTNKVCDLLHDGWCHYATDFWPTQNGIGATYGGSTDTREFAMWDGPTKVKNCIHSYYSYYSYYLGHVFRGVSVLTCNWN